MGNNIDVAELVKSGAVPTIQIGVEDLKTVVFSMANEYLKQKENDEKEISAHEAAEFLGVTLCTLYNWEKSGYLTPCRRVGRQKKYKMSQLKELKGFGL